MTYVFKKKKVINILIYKEYIREVVDNYILHSSMISWNTDKRKFLWGKTASTVSMPLF